MNTLICPKHSPKNLWVQLEPKKLQPTLKIDFFEENSNLLSLDAYKAHMAKGDFEAFGRPLRNSSRYSGKQCYRSTRKLSKNIKNTVFGYKKGSNFESDIGSRSATQTLYIVIFATFA